MKTKIYAILLVIALVLSMSACGKSKNTSDDPRMDMSKEQLIDMLDSYEKQSDADLEEIISLEDRIDELETMLKGIQTEDVKTAAITEFSDGTGRLTLHSIDSIVELPEPFEYPGSTQAVNSSSITLANGVSIKPSFNWNATLLGTEIRMSHSGSEIACIFKIGAVESSKKIKTEDFKDHINKFFESMPPTNIKYSKIYIGTTWNGEDASASVFVDEKPVQLRCGFINAGVNCVSYIIAYKGEMDSSKEELVLNLLQTIEIGSNSLRIE